jgi:hypothetical protein
MRALTLKESDAPRVKSGGHVTYEIFRGCAVYKTLCIKERSSATYDSDRKLMLKSCSYVK